MLNQQVQIRKVVDGDGGQVATYVIASMPFKLRKSRMMPLWKFRDTYIPPKGLWEHYFRCNTCEWERRTIAYCKYCEKPMSEIGSPGQIIHEVNGTSVYKLRSDLLQKVREKRGQIGDAKPINKIDGVRVFNIADLK